MYVGVHKLIESCELAFRESQFKTRELHSLHQAMKQLYQKYSGQTVTSNPPITGLKLPSLLIDSGCILAFNYFDWNKFDYLIRSLDGVLPKWLPKKVHSIEKNERRPIFLNPEEEKVWEKKNQKKIERIAKKENAIKEKITKAFSDLFEVLVDLRDHLSQHTLSKPKRRKDSAVKADVERGLIIIDGIEFSTFSHHCQMVKALIDEKGMYVSGPEMLDLKGCAGKNICREIKALEEKIPPIKQYLQHCGNKGYRIIS
jgi:hypothetical protein